MKPSRFLVHALVATSFVLVSCAAPQATPQAPAAQSSSRQRKNRLRR
jgi:hypothetical protein